MERPDLAQVAVIIPAHNERKTIAGIVSAAGAHGRVVVVDDGSCDGTGDLAEAAGADIVRLDPARGYDGALEAGFLRAYELGVAYAVTLDADGQHPTELIPRFIDELRKDAWVVFGVRPRTARFAEAVFSRVAAWRFGIQDPLCGMKGYRMTWYRQHGRFDGTLSIGTELGLAAARAGHSFSQIPVPIAARTDAPRFGHALRANCRIMRAVYLSLFS